MLWGDGPRTNKQHFGHVNLWKDHVFEGFGTKNVKTRSFDFLEYLFPGTPFFWPCQPLKRPRFRRFWNVTKDVKTRSFDFSDCLFPGSPSTHVNLWKDHVFEGFRTKNVKTRSFDFLEYLFPGTPFFWPCQPLKRPCFEGFGTKDVKTRSIDFLVCGYEYICSTVQSVTVLIRNPRNDWGLPLNRSDNSLWGQTRTYIWYMYMVFFRNVFSQIWSFGTFWWGPASYSTHIWCTCLIKTKR